METAGRNDAIDTAFHEAWHSMDVQDGAIGPGVDTESYNQASAYEGYYDQDGELRSDNHYTAGQHNNTSAFGKAMGDTYCHPPPSAPVGAESGSGTFPIEIDWDSAWRGPRSRLRTGARTG